MIKRLCLFFSTVFIVGIATAQTDTTTSFKVNMNQSGAANSDEVYHIKPAIDIPIGVVTAGYSLYGMSQIYGRDKTPEATVLALNVNDINSFDRPVADNYDDKAKSMSDNFFYGSMPLPLVLLLDKEIRKDGLKIGLLYLQAMGATGTLYTSSAMIADRFRPYVYNSSVDMGTRTRGGGRNSFFAGHPGLVATSTFFAAKVYTDYHPNMRHKWTLYTVAGGAAAATGLLRIKAGQHFRTDVITGVAVGTLSGILIPHLHKNNKNPKYSFMPNFSNGQNGFTVLMKIE